MAPRKSKVPEDDLLVAMRRAIMNVLEDPEADLPDRMRAIEAAAKILAIEYKIREKTGTRYGSFFAAGSTAEDE